MNTLRFLRTKHKFCLVFGFDEVFFCQCVKGDLLTGDIKSANLQVLIFLMNS